MLYRKDFGGVLSPKAAWNILVYGLPSLAARRALIVDREQVEGPVKILGYRYAPQKYEEIPLDAQGRLWLEPLRVWLGTRAVRYHSSLCNNGRIRQ